MNTDPTTQTLTIAWIQTTRTLRTYLAALPLPITIGKPTNPNHLENISTDLARAHQALTNAPFPTELTDHLRQATALLLMVLGHIGRTITDTESSPWVFEAAHLALRQATTKLNQAGSWE